MITLTLRLTSSLRCEAWASGQLSVFSPALPMLVHADGKIHVCMVLAYAFEIGQQVLASGRADLRS